MMDIANISFISHTLYLSIQKKLLFPSIHHVYTTHRQILLDIAREKNNIDILGDGRCDSPGYSAKYGTYTIMNGSSGEILDFHIAHKTLAGNSARMELDGFKKVLERIENNGVKINSLTTDRHKQLRSFIRKERKDIKHQFDVWHVGKNIKKKLLKLAKKITCSDLKPWIKAVINHFWWSCSSCNGNVKELKEKWISILCHVTNKHRWEGNTYFKRCQHKRITKREKREKKWLKLGTPSYLALEKVVLNKYLLADLKYLTDFNHTGTLEVYHSLYNKYCPKRLHFSYHGMIARSQLAVLDFNSGVGAQQATTKAGNLRFKQQYSRITDTWVLKKIASKKNRTYRYDLMEDVFYLKKSNENYPIASLHDVPQNIAPIEKPDKAEAMMNQRTRFIL